MKIPEVTIENVSKLSMKQILDGLRPYVLEEVPEGIIDEPDGVKIVDRLIGRFANLYAYMMFLFGHLNSEAGRFKLTGDDAEAAITTKKKDAVFELARAVRYKQEACSRMLTALLREIDDDEVFSRPDHGARVATEQRRRSGKKGLGWAAVGDSK